MTTRRFVVPVLLFAVLALSAVSLRASDRIGIYTIVEKVVFEPSEAAPQRVQIWGVFALADARSGSAYLPPRRGYVYYTIAPGKEEICRKEWADLKAVAGTGQGIGFGFRRDTATRVRKASDKVEAPDVYPVSIGLVRMGPPHDNAAVLPALREALRQR
jgi:hypothetical protein